MDDLTYLRADPQRSKYLSQKVLCQTLAGNDVPLITITNPSCAADMKNKQGKKSGNCQVKLSLTWNLKVPLNNPVGSNIFHIFNF